MGISSRSLPLRRKERLSDNPIQSGNCIQTTPPRSEEWLQGNPTTIGNLYLRGATCVLVGGREGRLGLTIGVGGTYVGVGCVKAE